MCFKIYDALKLLGMLLKWFAVYFYVKKSKQKPLENVNAYESYSPNVNN